MTTPGMTTLQMRSGCETPTSVILLDGSVVTPDVNGQITVSLEAARCLFTANWIEVPPAPAGLGGPYASANQPGALLTLDPETGDVYQLGGSS